jgi:hypothetical protein
MGHEARLLERDDLPAAWEMIRIAFGVSREWPPGWDDWTGRLDRGAFDKSGRLVAKATDRRPASGAARLLLRSRRCCAAR